MCALPAVVAASTSRPDRFACESRAWKDQPVRRIHKNFRPETGIDGRCAFLGHGGGIPFRMINCHSHQLPIPSQSPGRPRYVAQPFCKFCHQSYRFQLARHVGHSHPFPIAIFQAHGNPSPFPHYGTNRGLCDHRTGEFSKMFCRLILGMEG